MNYISRAIAVLLLGYWIASANAATPPTPTSTTDVPTYKTGVAPPIGFSLP